MHCDLDGHRRAEPVEYRTNQNEESIGANNPLNDAHFRIQAHGAVISVVMFGFAVLILFAFLKPAGV